MVRLTIKKPLKKKSMNPRFDDEELYFEFDRQKYQGPNDRTAESKKKPKKVKLKKKTFYPPRP